MEMDKDEEGRGDVQKGITQNKTIWWSTKSILLQENYILEKNNNNHSDWSDCVRICFLLYIITIYHDRMQYALIQSTESQWRLILTNPVVYDISLRWLFKNINLKICFLICVG